MPRSATTTTDVAGRVSTQIPCGLFNLPGSGLFLKLKISNKMKDGDYPCGLHRLDYFCTPLWF
jgi:hypothetical protein